jgi:SAM-dependent methyltransferase
MTTARVLDHDPGDLTFRLPPERAACLTRAAGPANLALQAQYVGLLALVEDQIVDCFRHGGGVPYSAYPKFQALMAEDSGAVHDVTLIDVILPLVPGLTNELERGIEVADIGCGSGHAVNLMAETYPASRFIGVDIADSGLAAGTAEAKRKGLANVRFQKQDGTRWIRSLRPHHDIRRHPRPGAARPGTERYRQCTTAGRCLPVCRHRRVERRGRKPRPSARAFHVHGVVHALHDGVSRSGRHGTWRDVG